MWPASLRWAAIAFLVSVALLPGPARAQFPCALPGPVNHYVSVNSDGSFTPSELDVCEGDSVTWTLGEPGRDSVVEVPSDSIDRCAVPLSFEAGLDRISGPMPEAASGIFALGPQEEGLEQHAGSCPRGTTEMARDGTDVLCRSSERFSAMRETLTDDGIDGIYIRIPWSSIHVAPGTADASFDFTALDREIDRAVRQGKLYSLVFKAGKDGIPDWIFTTHPDGSTRPYEPWRVPRIAMQADYRGDTCGSFFDIAYPGDVNYERHYLDLLFKVSEHLKARLDRYRALAYVKLSGANNFSSEGGLPKTCLPQCPVCARQVWSRHRYDPGEIVRFHQVVADAIAGYFPGKSMNYQLLQAGYPRVGAGGAYKDAEGNWRIGQEVDAPGNTEQTESILEHGRLEHGRRFTVSHNGLGVLPHPLTLSDLADASQPRPSARTAATPTLPADYCDDPDPDTIKMLAQGCPNAWVMHEASLGQVTGFQTNNARSSNPNAISTPAQLENALQNQLDNSLGIYTEIYEEVAWKVRRQGGVLDPEASVRTLADWAGEWHQRRRTLYADLPDPKPDTHVYEFDDDAGGAGTVTRKYRHGHRCATGGLGTIVVHDR